MDWRPNKNEKEKLKMMSRFGAWTTSNSRYLFIKPENTGAMQVWDSIGGNQSFILDT